MANSKTHNPGVVHIDEQARRALVTVQWPIELNDATHPITANNALEFLMCGAESFARIAQDIEAAQDSIDLVCWGFDPAMELERGEQDVSVSWPRGKTYGDVLRAAAMRGVKVRLLVWHGSVEGIVQNNMPGYTGDQRAGRVLDQTAILTFRDEPAFGKPVSTFVYKGAASPPSNEEQRQSYAVQWWRTYMSGRKLDGYKGSLSIALRAGSNAADVIRSMNATDGTGTQEDPLDDNASDRVAGIGVASEQSLVQSHATHHQKTILIDYAYKGGEKAVGYVMGLNSTTDYWDTADHLFRDARREIDWARKSPTARAQPAGQSSCRDPYRDYVSRIQGPALEDVQRNFTQAWKRSGAPAGLHDGGPVPARLKDFARPGSRIQIVRTQPQEGDKTIKSAYWQASSFARNYLYIENQYFYYELWVRHLKETRQKFMTGVQENSKNPSQAKLLHLIAVIPWPEDDGMVPRTYDTVKSLGEGTSFARQHEVMQADAAARAKYAQDSARNGPNNHIISPALSPVSDSAAKVQVPMKNEKTGELKSMGLKVLIGRLVTRNQGTPMPRPEQDYRQVYIHSKLMGIDDSFVTLGSANLNVRSMAADSEINMLTDDHEKAQALRQRVWGANTGGYGESAGGDGSPKAIVNAFKDWQKIMAQNLNAQKDGDRITGFVIPFSDDRVSSVRRG